MTTKKRESAICVWDFTIPKTEYKEHTDLINILHKNCKKWSFQLEKGEKTGFEHYQGRISLKNKQRLKQVKEIFTKKCHLSITSNANKGNSFYVMKEETRIKGPWCDEKDKPVYIPRQIREIENLYEWQKTIIEMSQKWDTRHIDLIIDTTGNIGKSILCTYMGVHKMANMIPFCNDYKDILRMVMDRPKRKAYLIDMPRAINKEKLFQLFSAIETIKNGYAYDDRYNFREEYFDCPNIFVFTNKIPDKSLLSPDRWRYWRVSQNKLIKY